MSSSRRSRSRRWKALLGNILVVILGLVALLLLVGLFLPRTYRLQRSVEIRSAPEAVYAQISALRQWPEWTAWNKERDPGVRWEFGTPDAGTGANYKWTGDKLGTGRMVLTKAEPGKGVWFELEFDGGATKATGSLTMESSGEKVRLVWLMEGDLGRSPVARYFGLFMEGMVGPDFEQGLERLRVMLEGGAQPKSGQG